MFLGRVVSPDEPLWLDADRDKVRAYLLDKAQRCVNCGVHSEDNDERHLPVEPELYRCFVCKEAERVREDVPRDLQQGITVRLRPAAPTVKEQGMVN